MHLCCGRVMLNSTVLLPLPSLSTPSYTHHLPSFPPFPTHFLTVSSLPAHLDLSASSTGDDLSLLPFCKEPSPPREGEGMSLDHMSVSERVGERLKGRRRRKERREEGRGEHENDDS